MLDWGGFSVGDVLALLVVLLGKDLELSVMGF
jgi:hypothetical protein